MENNSTLNKKLKSYSALAGTLIAAGSANAQVMYTDVIPDVTIPLGGTYNLNLDNNAVVDFVLRVTHGTDGTYVYDYAGVTPSVVGNASDTAAASGENIAHALNAPINASLLWNDGSYGFLAGNQTAPSVYAYGQFLGTTDKYIGFKFKIAGADHYGWARVDVNATATSMVIKDYGYDATPNTQVLCGAMPVAVNSPVNLEAVTKIYSGDNTITIKLINHSTVDGFIFITDVLGHVISKTILNNETTIIPMDSTPGIYFATVNKADGSTFTKKVFLK